MPTEENMGIDDNTPADQRLGAFLEGAGAASSGQVLLTADLSEPE